MLTPRLASTPGQQRQRRRWVWAVLLLQLHQSNEWRQAFVVAVQQPRAGLGGTAEQWVAGPAAEPDTASCLCVHVCAGVLCAPEAVWG